MKSFLFASAFIMAGSCATLSHKEKIENIKSEIVISEAQKIQKYARSITIRELELYLYTIASKDFEGRQVGTLGQKRAVNFIRDYYIDLNIPSPYGNDNYFQNVPSDYLGDYYQSSENVLAYIEGDTYPDEIVIVSAHHDHEGIDDDGRLFYGADDNASGTVALMEMAEAFKKAKDDGFGPDRSILFIHFTAEEIGLHGSRFYTENPIFPLKNTVANLNIDMIGRVDKAHQDNPEYLYLIGSNRLSTKLHYVSEAVNEYLFNFELDYKFNDEADRNRYYYRSDHYNFAKHNIPVIFYFNGEHEDYHQPSDTPDKINYELLQKRTQLIFATAWQLANQENRIVVDQD
jgi:hypothetical protein